MPMRNNPEFNVFFVSIVKKYEVLYNHTVEGYSSKECLKEAWQKVAEEVKHSEQECKERWRCLRVCYLRQLRYSQPHIVTGRKNQSKKSYYLADALSFLLPFVKPKHAPMGYSIAPPPFRQVKPEPNFSFDIEEEQLGPEDLNEDQNIELYPEDLLDEHEQEHDHSNPSSIASIRVPEYHTEKESPEHRPGMELYYAPSSSNEHSAEQESRKRLKLAPVYQLSTDELEYSGQQSEEDGDLHFLKSLLPDMRKLNAKQKRKFKQRVLGLFDDITDEDATSS